MKNFDNDGCLALLLVVFGVIGETEWYTWSQDHQYIEYKYPYRDGLATVDRQRNSNAKTFNPYRVYGKMRRLV